MLRILSISLTLALAGCASIMPVVKEVSVDCGAPPRADALALVEVSPYILKINAEVHACTSLKDYQLGAVNLSRITASFKQKNALISYYQQCIELHNKDPTAE